MLKKKAPHRPFLGSGGGCRDEPSIDYGHNTKLEEYVLYKGDKCLWQCYWLSARSMLPKDCSTETNNWTNCVCDHLLDRSKFLQCVVFVCGEQNSKAGDQILSLSEEFVSSQIVFPGHFKGTAPLGIWTICADVKAWGELTFAREGDQKHRIYDLLGSGQGVRWWLPDIHDEELDSTLYSSSRDNRLTVPFWLDRFLRPIWSQDNLPSSRGYPPPPDAGNVKNPRSTLDRLQTIFSVHCPLLCCCRVRSSFAYGIRVREILDRSSSSDFIYNSPWLANYPARKLLPESHFQLGPQDSDTIYPHFVGRCIFERRTTSNYLVRLIDLSLQELEEGKQVYSSGQFWGRILAISASLY
jgi:hypothetical protein